jgi:hypothetical protein
MAIDSTQDLLNKLAKAADNAAKVGEAMKAASRRLPEPGVTTQPTPAAPLAPKK